MLSQQKTLKKKSRAPQSNQPFSYLKKPLSPSRWTAFLSLVANNSKAAHALWFSISFCAICLFTFFFTRSYTEKLLPKTVVVHSSNQKTAAQIEHNLIKLLHISYKNHDSRTTYLNEVNRVLSNNEMINHYLIRSGLDQKLQVFLTLQTPYLTLEDKGGAPFLVSRDLKIISKAVDPEILKNLPTLVLPEIKIDPITFDVATIKNNKRNSSIKETLLPSSFNLPWLASTSQTILENMYEIGFPFAVKRIFWRSNSGFSVLVAQGKVLVSIELGTHEIAKKMQRLKVLLDHPQIRSLKFTSIDLSFSDKATILE